MYLSDLRVYFKVEVYTSVFQSNLKQCGGVQKSQKTVDYANTTKVQFIPWRFYSMPVD